MKNATTAAKSHFTHIIKKKKSFDADSNSLNYMVPISFRPCLDLGLSGVKPEISNFLGNSSIIYYTFINP
jgi:hypothetical protein